MLNEKYLRLCYALHFLNDVIKDGDISLKVLSDNLILDKDGCLVCKEPIDGYNSNIIRGTFEIFEFIENAKVFFSPEK